MPIPIDLDELEKAADPPDFATNSDGSAALPPPTPPTGFLASARSSLVRPRAILIPILAVVLVAGGGFLSLRELRQEQQQLRAERGADLAANVASALSHSLGHGEDLEDLANDLFLRLIGHATHGLGLAYAFVIDAEGNVRAHTDAARRGEVVSQGPGPEATLVGYAISGSGTPGAHGEATVEHASPLFGKEGAIGAVVLGLAADPPAFRLADARPILFPALAALLLLPITYSVVRLSVRPLLDTGRELRALLEAQNVPGLPVLPTGAEFGQMVNGVRDLVRELARIFRAQEEKRRQAEVEARVLAYERRRLEAVLERVPDGIVLKGPDGRVEMVNRSAEKILGIERGQALAGRFPLDELLLAGPEGGGESRGRRERVDVAVSTVPLQDGERNPLGTLHLVRDLARQRLAEQAQHEFVSHVAHEVKSPLNTLRSYTEILMDEEINDRETRKEFFNTMNEETNRLARLIDNLLSLSRIEMGRVRVERQFVKIQNLVDHAVQAVAQQAKSKGLRFEVNLPDRLGSLQGDRELLEVALINLMGNAVKYTPAGGRVSLQVEERPDQLLCRVTDTGPGIVPEEQKRVFEKFFRSASHAAAAPGHGLGLPLAREIARIHGGDILLDSEPGKGSTFALALPLETQSADRLGPAESHPVPVGAGQET